MAVVVVMVLVVVVYKTATRTAAARAAPAAVRLASVHIHTPTSLHVFCDFFRALARRLTEEWMDVDMDSKQTSTDAKWKM